MHSFRLEACLGHTCEARVNLHRHGAFSEGRACFIQLFAIKKYVLGKALAFLSCCLEGESTLCNIRASWGALGFDLKLGSLVLHSPELAWALCYTWSVSDKGNSP